MGIQIMRVEPGGKPKLCADHGKISLETAISFLDASAHLEADQREDVERIEAANRTWGCKQYRRHLLGPRKKALATYFLTFLPAVPEGTEIFERPEKDNGCC